MNTSSNNPAIVLLRERVDDLAAYLEQWATRAAVADRLVMRATGAAALERINAIAGQMRDMGVQLVAEIAAYADPVRHDEDGWPILRPSADPAGTAWERHDDPEGNR